MTEQRRPIENTKVMLDPATVGLATVPVADEDGVTSVPAITFSLPGDELDTALLCDVDTFAQLGRCIVELAEELGGDADRAEWTT